MRVRDDHGLRRYQPCEYGCACGQRANEVVWQRTPAIDWNRSDYGPVYARTKKFCEHMVRQLLAWTCRARFSAGSQHCAGR